MSDKIQINNQLILILSWRFAAEMWRSVPNRFDLLETHPGGGMYDCLVFRAKENELEGRIELNRVSSLHLMDFPSSKKRDMASQSDWMEQMLCDSQMTFVDKIKENIGLDVSAKLPSSTPATITYRFIADFLAHSMGKLEYWDCRNGVCDTSGYGGGIRDEFFDKFPAISDRKNLRHTVPVFKQYEYNFWFLLRDAVPVLCLDTTGMVYRTDGVNHNIYEMYKRDRRIWPLIFEVAKDLLP